MIIQNFLQLNTSTPRKQVLRILEAGLQAFSPEALFAKFVRLNARRGILYIGPQKIELKKYKRIFCMGCDRTSKLLAENLLAQLKQVGISAAMFSDEGEEVFSGSDLIIAITAASLLKLPYENTILKHLDEKGASLEEVHTVAAHMAVEGKDLVKKLYPARILNVIFTQNIQDSPLTLDATSVRDAARILEKYDALAGTETASVKLVETPKEEHCFRFLTTAHLSAPKQIFQSIKEEAENLGFKVLGPGEEYAGLEGLGRGTILIMSFEHFPLALFHSGIEQKRLTLALIGRGKQTGLLSGAVLDPVSIKFAASLGLQFGNFASESQFFSFFEDSGIALQLPDMSAGSVGFLVAVKN